MWFLSVISYAVGVCSSCIPHITTTVVLFILTKFLWKLYVISKARDKTSAISDKIPIPPGDFGLPLIGETIAWALEGKMFVRKRREKFGNIFCTHMIGEPVVRVTGAKNIKELISNDHRNVVSKMPKSATTILGVHSLTQSTGDGHKRRKAAVLKAFSHSAIDKYIPVMSQSIQKQISKWAYSETHAPLVYKDICSMTNSLAFQLFLGINIEDIEQFSTIKKNFKMIVNNLFSLPIEVMGMGFKKAMDARRDTHAMLDRHIAKKKEASENNMHLTGDTSANDALQYLIDFDMKEQQRRKMAENESDCSDLMDDRNDNSELLTSTEIRELAIELLLAGTSTNASILSSLLHQLAQHPEVMEKLEEELKMFGLLPTSKNDFHEDEAYLTDDEYSQKSSEINIKTLSKLKYLDRVVKETMRVLPPIPGVYRKAIKTFKLGEYRIPKGWSILYNITDTQDTEWDNADKFYPDRFCDDSFDKREDRYKWLPFGRGSRRCIGKDYAQTLCKVFLIEVMRKFKSWKFASGKPSQIRMIPMHHPADDMPMIFESQ